MRAPIIALALLTLAAPAFAADASGSVKAIDSKTSTVTLDNGTSYIFMDKAAVEKLKVGEKVTITFDVKDGKNEATKVAEKM